MRMNIALSCLPTSYLSCDENKTYAVQAVQEASRQGSELIAFPEMGLTGYGRKARSVAEACASPGFFSALAREYGITILFGHLRKEGARWYNSATLLDVEGRELYTYDKIHPFTYAAEDTYVTGGTDICSALVNGVSVGVSICYDLRFSELYRMLSRRAPVVVNLAAWPREREPHFKALLQSRAIEFQIYSIGVNQSGVSPKGVQYGGQAFVFDARGNQVITEQAGDHLFTAEIVPELVPAVRSEFPVSSDARLDLYSSWYDEFRDH